MTEEFDAVTRPKHYNTLSVECIEVTQHMNFCLGNAVKYLWRHEFKENPTEDLKKAAWYINAAKKLPLPPVHYDVIEPLSRFMSDPANDGNPVKGAVQALVMADSKTALDLALSIIDVRLEELQ